MTNSPISYKTTHHFTPKIFDSSIHKVIIFHYLRIITIGSSKTPLSTQLTINHYYMQHNCIHQLTQHTMDSSFDTKQTNILIVDDNIENIGVLGNILLTNQYNLEYALNGKDALTYIEESNFDLILLDIMMPEMNGFEVCEKIRSNPKNNDLPIIFLTAKTDTESIIKGFELGAQDYIHKPFESNELLARVKTHIELRKNKLKLKEVNTWLSEKVKEKTADLSRANSRLIKLDNEKNRLFELISTELKSPLNKISEVVQSSRDNATTRKLQFYLELLQISSVRLEHLTHKMHDEIDLAGREKEANVDFAQLLNEAVEINNKKIQKKRLAIKPELNCTNIFTYAENEVLCKCLINTMSFAIDSSTRKEEILFKTLFKSGFTNITIEYQGERLPDNVEIDNLMKTYNMHPIENNPGISLYLCNLIVEIYNGGLELDNANEKQTITIKLPFKGY